MFGSQFAFFILLCILPLFNFQDCDKSESRIRHLFDGINAIKPGYWIRLNDNKLVCFQTRGNSPGRFQLKYDGFLGAVKLVHVYGYVTCSKHNPQHSSYWGCTRHPLHRWKEFNIFLVGHDSKQLFIGLPDSNFSWFSHDFFKPTSKEFVFMNMTHPHYVTHGYEISIWYGDDKRDRNEEHSGGETCVDVYGHFI